MEHPKHIIVVGGLIRNDAGDILLIHHYKRGWEIPQGRVEEGEELMEAFHREVLEETGVEVAPLSLAAIASKVSPPSAVIFSFIARYAGGELRTSDESLEVKWVSETEALALVTHPVNRNRLETLLTAGEQTLFRSYSTSPFTVLSETSMGTPQPQSP